MKSIEFKGHTIKMFDNAESMPMKRYQRFNKFLMIANEVGSDFEDFNRRTQKAISLLRSGLKDEAVKELDNRRLMVYNSFMEYSPTGRALAILVHSIDDNDYSKGFEKESLDSVLDKLEEIGFTKKLADKTVSEVKKK